MKAKRNLIQNCLLCALVLVVFVVDAQPVITQQPTNQTAVVGGGATFNVAVSGTGPFNYQWQFNGTYLPNGIITTVAGNGTAGYGGDSSSATNAEINKPYDVAMDANGNLFIADYGNNRIRKVSTNGIISTVAGNILNPNAVAVDANGNLFIAYNGNYIIKVSTNSNITTVAGNGNQGYAGDGGIATNAEINGAQGIAVDASGNLFIADTWNNRIRKVSTNGIISTVAGNGVRGYAGDSGAATNAEFYFPIGIAVDASGNLFIGDNDNYCIRKVSTNGIILTVASITNPSGPDGIALDASGNLFVANSGYIFQASTNGTVIRVAGNGGQGFAGDGGSATSATLYYPNGVAVDANGNLFIADKGNNRIRKVSSSPSLVLNSISANNAGSYSVIITSSSGSVTSSVATLLLPPSIIAQPQNQFAILGGSASFSVSVSSATDPSYQWYCLNNLSQAGASAQVAYGYCVGATVTNGGAGYTTIPNVRFVGGGGSGAMGTASISNGMVTTITVTNVGSGYTSLPAVLIDAPTGTLVGQTNSTLTLNPVTTNNAGNYYVVITNGDGSVTSSVATLATAVVPSITQQPTNQSIVLGNTAVFSVVVSGTGPFSYQWCSNSVSIVNATNATLTLNTVQTNFAASYSVIVTNVVGSVTSSNAMLTVLIPPSFTKQPTNQSIVLGNTAVFSVVANGTSPFSYQWRSNSVSIVNATNATLTLNTVQTNFAASYSVIVTNLCGSVTSSNALLTVLTPPSIIQQPQNQTVSTGSNASFNVVAIGTSPLGYQWWMVCSQQSNATAGPIVINGFVVAVTMTNVGSGYLAIPTVQFVGGSGSGATGTAVVSNRMVTAITMNSVGSGYTTPPTVQIAAPTAIILTSQTNSILSLLAVVNTNAGNYFVVVKNNYGSVTSSFASLIVAPAGYNQISSPVLKNGKVNLSFVGLQGTNYALDRSFSLSPANWIPQVTNPADANGNLIFTNAPDPTTNNFWRIRTVP